jgi:predicted unusual protein kinase regulating ubiquinone biosynthesis (AarF/ABC1/UbiB family)
MLEGTFHADLHPGNVLLLADGRLALRVLVLVFRPDTR